MNSNWSYWIVGGPKMGKTAFLLQLERDFSESQGSESQGSENQDQEKSNRFNIPKSEISSFLFRGSPMQNFVVVGGNQQLTIQFPNDPRYI